MGEFILEHKKISCFLGFLMIFYFFVVNPLETTFHYKKSLKTKTERLKNIEIKNKAVNERIEELTLEKKESEKKYKIMQENGSEFASVGEYQNYLGRFMEKYNIKLVETARTHERENQYTIPYTVTGTEKNIMNFISDAEKDEKINLMLGAAEFVREKEKIKFRFSTGVRINKIKDKSETEKRKAEFFSSETKKTVIEKYMLINSNKGIFYISSEEENRFNNLVFSEENRKSIKRYYLKNNEKAVIEGKEYFVNLEENLLILKDSETMEKIMVFDLGERRENNGESKKDVNKKQNQK